MTNIQIVANGKTIPAALNDTVAAKDFATRLPLTFRGSNSGIDICCTARAGKVDDSQRRDGWKNGDISLTGGWFALLYGGQEMSRSYRGMMIIGHIDDAYLGQVASFPSSVSITVQLAD